MHQAKLDGHISLLEISVNSFGNWNVSLMKRQKSVSVYSEKGRKAHQGYEGESKEDTSQSLSIDMDDEVFL